MINNFQSNFSKNLLFPIFLKAEELSILLVGGGPVGLEKASAILANSPNCNLTIVAIEILPEILELKNSFPQISIYKKEFEETDLVENILLFLAVNNKVLSQEIKAIANAKNILVNVADTPDLCDFYLSAIVQKGDLKIAISTNGKSPTIAKRVKEMLQELMPDDMQELLENMTQIREKLKGNFESKVKQLNEITSSFLSKKD